MSHKKSMKTGFCQSALMAPPMLGGPFGGGGPLAGIKWQIDQCVEMGGSVICGGFGFPGDEKSKAEIRDYLQQKGVEFEFYTFGWQGLLGPDSAGAKDQTLKSFAESKYYGNHIVRSAYNGGLRYEFSRFNKARPIKEHMKEVTNILKAAKPIFEGEGMTLAIENHCDFTAKEWAEIFAEINSPNIGCGYDTANDYTVYADPNEQVEYIAPFVVSTHMKDMACTQYWTPDRDLIPYQARGTALGDGNVDIPKMIDEFDKKSPKAEGLRLIIEQGWMDIPMGVNPAELHAQYLRKGMKYLNSLVH